MGQEFGLYGLMAAADMIDTMCNHCEEELYCAQEAKNL
jgi:hypothetical protein